MADLQLPPLPHPRVRTHHLSCAVFDPTTGPCDCGSMPKVYDAHDMREYARKAVYEWEAARGVTPAAEAPSGGVIWTPEDEARLDAAIAKRNAARAARVNPACGVHGPIPCEGAGCICTPGVMVAPEPEPRFFMDHGMWHDRETGQHLYTEDQHAAALREIKDSAWSALEAAGIPRDGWWTIPEAIAKLAFRARGVEKEIRWAKLALYLVGNKLKAIGLPEDDTARINLAAAVATLDAMLAASGAPCPHNRTKHLGTMMSKREAKFCLDCRETFYIDSGAPAGVSGPRGETFSGQPPMAGKG